MDLAERAKKIRGELCIECECTFDRGCGCLEAIMHCILDTIELCAAEVEDLGGDNAQFHADGIRRRLTANQ